MGPWRKGSTSSSGGIEDQKSTGLSKRQSVVVEVIENQARTEDTEAKAEDSQGKAKDTQVKGNPFKEVEIILTPDGLGKEHKEVSKEDGKATFLDVPEGDYIVTAKKDGFKFQQIAITSGPLKDEHKSRKISENVLNVEERLNAVRKVSASWMQRTMSHTETSPTSQSEIKISVKKNETTPLRLLGKYNPLLDTWAISDGTEQKAVSELTYDSCLEKLYFTIKLVTQALVFLITLAAGVVSRGITFFMVSQLSSKAVTVCSSEGALVASNTALEKVGWLWCIFFAFAIPEVLHFLKSLNSCLSRNVGTVEFLARFLKYPFLFSFLAAVLLDACHVVGLGILFFFALPRVDSFTGVMLTSGVCLLPGLLKIVGDIRRRAWIKLALSMLATGVLIGALVMLPVKVTDTLEKGKTLAWATPLGLILTSFGWWQNFTTKNTISMLNKVKVAVNDKRVCFFVGIISALWKILVFFGCLSIIPVLGGTVPDNRYIFRHFRETFEMSSFDIASANGTAIRTRHYDGFMDTPWFLLILQLGSTLFAYTSSRFACKLGDIRLRLGPRLDTGIAFSFAAPAMVLVTPVSISILMSFCYLRNFEGACYYSRFPTYLFFACPAIPVDSPWALLMGGLMFVAYFWVTSHVWTAHSLVLASELQIFGCNYYNGLLVDQGMMLCRKRREDKKDEEENNEEEEKFKRNKKNPDEEAKMEESRKFVDKTIRIKGCATMWHETSEEIKVMLKSVFKIDDDYYARRKALNLLPEEDMNKKSFEELENNKKDDVDFFEWETHIFFDDCMAKPVKGQKDNVNSYVKDLIGAVDEYGKQWYGKKQMAIPELTKYVTPYGGRLVWNLPGGTSMTCHLKDKKKIRHKKRWSQIMYMYYFLGYQLKGDSSLKTEEEKKHRADNTFLLALDGDVDFQPDAIVKGFKEFYNQRRRWMPSTLLNIADLIGDYKQVPVLLFPDNLFKVIEKNDDISLMYILYQGMMMVGTVIGPGSIILMLIGAFSLALGLTNDEALIFNVVIVGTFIGSCIFAKADHQIRLAELLTVLYAIVMIAVYIGVVLTIIDDGPLSLSAIGIWATFGSFLLAALLHPQEFGCLFSILIYLCTIPSMYLLLVIYAFFNMDNQGWGTREGPKLPAAVDDAKLTPMGLLANAKLWATSKLMKTPGSKQPDPLGQVEVSGVATQTAGISRDTQTEDNPKDQKEKPKMLKDLMQEESKSVAEKFDLSEGALPFDRYEEVFWRKMIGSTDYLKPLNYTPDESEEIRQGLEELKNKYASGFIMINAMWVAAIFMLQKHQDQLNVRWPLGEKVLGITWGTNVGEARDVVNIHMDYLQLEPIGTFFMVTFILIMAIQFVGMIQHRLMTLSHIVATTNKTFNAAEESLQNRGLTEKDKKFMRLIDEDLGDASTNGASDPDGLKNRQSGKRGFHSVEETIVELDAE